ncbi:MAG: hypothetical protein A3F13_02170 [Gammaproteobacteria bacterium RIFCSPHIGHO2_12_FULL_40_19]|nr:MAG: hypothetical protein A3F13_02170 [Gammaproteobacteria bacterium RIFCSPHIGHO2_12_FULL_40_19]
MMSIKKTISVCMALIFLAAFSFSVLLHVQINADVLYPFSFAKDLITHLSIRHWYYPGPLFIFPDVLLSIAIVAFVKTPVLWAALFSFIQILALIILIAAFSQDKKTLPFSIKFTAGIYLTALIYFVGRVLFHTQWAMIADKSGVAVHHMSGALAALLLFFLTVPTTFSKASAKKIIFILCFMFLMSFSDPYFDYYFFMLILPYLFIDRLRLFQLKHWVRTMIGIAIAGISGILLNGMLNPGLWIEFHTSHTDSTLLNIVQNTQNFRYTMGWAGILLVFVLPLLLLFLAIKHKKTHLFSLCISMEFISIGCLLLDMFKGDMSFLRYIDIYFPIIIYAAFELTSLRFFKLTQTMSVAIIAILIAFFYAHHNFKHTHVAIFPQEFHAVLACPDLHKTMPNTVFVATYWPAKVLFEATNRTASMIEINPDMTAYPWIYNPAWQNISKNPSSLLISTYQLDPTKIAALSALSNAETLCNGQLIHVPFGPKLFKLAPILKKHEV